MTGTGDARRRERDNWTDIAYLIVAAVSLVLVARLWARVIQPWAAGVIAQLTWQDLLLGAVALGFVVMAAMRVCATHRRRRAARGLRVVGSATAPRSHRPDGQRRKEPGAGPSPGWPKAITQ